MGFALCIFNQNVSPPALRDVSKRHDSILYLMLNESKEQSLVLLLLLWVMTKSLSNVLFLYSTVF